MRLKTTRSKERKQNIVTLRPDGGNTFLLLSDFVDVCSSVKRVDNSPLQAFRFLLTWSSGHAVNLERPWIDCKTHSKASYTLGNRWCYANKQRICQWIFFWLRRCKAAINNSAVDRGNTVNKDHRPPLYSLPFCSLPFTSLNSVALDQSDLSPMMSADTHFHTVVKVEATKLAGRGTKLRWFWLSGKGPKWFTGWNTVKKHVSTPLVSVVKGL